MIKNILILGSLMLLLGASSPVIPPDVTHDTLIIFDRELTFEVKHDRAAEFLRAVFDCEYPHWERATFLQPQDWYTELAIEANLEQAKNNGVAYIPKDFIKRDSFFWGGGQVGIHVYIWNNKLERFPNWNWVPNWDIEEE